jgi:alkylation response protein AidB-like acyl-CoA dehydrogenase
VSGPRPPGGAAAGPLVDFPLTAEQIAFQRIARDAADGAFRGRAARWDEREEYPWDNVKDLVAMGLMGMTIPREYGGRGAPVLDAILAIEAVARACGVTGRLLVDSNFGAVGAIVHYGTETQKRDFLPLVVQGDKPAIAISEPGAGSAAADLVTTAVADGETWRLDGVKHWITGAGVSRTYVVFCRFDGIPGAPGIGAVVVPADAPGLIVRRRERAMGMRGIPEGEVVFADCRVPRDHLLLGPGGFARLMAAYNGQRLGASAVALGLAQGASRRPCPTPGSAGSSDVRSAASRGCAGSSRTWRSRSKLRANSSTAPRTMPARAFPTSTPRPRARSSPARWPFA